MNYSKKGINNKQHNIKSTSKHLVSKTRISLFRFLIAFFVLVVIVGVFAGLGFVQGLIDSAPDISQIDVIPTGYTTTVYDQEGNEIEHLIGAHSNRVYVTIDQIPEFVQKAFVAIEDERFYEHDGIDVRGIIRAAVNGLKSGKFNQGASTITQQLLKNQVFGGGRESSSIERVERKIQEQYLAIQLEDKLDKNTILEYYLNTINLGSGTYGVQTASKRYFNKDVSKLNLSEAACIAAITQLPVYHNPITHPDYNAVRRKNVLDKMLSLNYCQQEYDEAIADDVYSRIQSVNEEMDTTSYYSYFVDELIDQVMKDLQTELGYTQTQASNLIYSGGLSIYTTQDSTIQGIVDDIYSDESYFPAMGTSLWELTYALSVQKGDAEGTVIHYHGDDLVDFYKDFKDPKGYYVDEGSRKFSLLFTNKEDMQEKIEAFHKAMVEEGDTVLGEKITMTIQPQSSFVVMDQHTGHVVAIIGGRGEKEGNRTLNRATDTVRQPGSTFKVLSTYLPALDTGKFTLASTIDDSGPYYYPGTKTEVNNWTRTKKYEGLTTLRRAIYNSMNIVTVKTLNEVTPQLSYDNYLLKLGFTSLVDSRVEDDGRVFTDIKLPMALGGLTDGVSNLELTAAYAAIANNGVYTKPIFYTKVLDHDGKVLLDNTPKTEQVMKKSTAFLLTSAMEDVIKKGTGGSYKLTTINMPIAGKTGSTSDYNDLWFSGYSPYYTATIWSGFDNNRPQTERSYQKKIWRTVMERIHSELNLETKSFPIPDSIVTAKVCSKSGKLAVEGLCDHYLGGNTVYTEYFAKGTEPTEKCDIHVKATICTESNALATEYCPISKQKEAVYLNKSETGNTADTPYLLPSKTCPIHKAGSSSIFDDDPLYKDDPLYEDEPYDNNNDPNSEDNSYPPDDSQNQLNDFYSNSDHW